MLSRKQFAKLVGAEKSELYYYEKRGLLFPDYISPSGYRYYSETSIETFKQIKSLQFVGYTLDEIQQHLDCSDSLTDEAFFDLREKHLSDQLALLQKIRSEQIIRQMKEKRLYSKPTAKRIDI